MVQSHEFVPWRENFEMVAVPKSVHEMITKETLKGPTEAIYE